MPAVSSTPVLQRLQGFSGSQEALSSA